jgi:hypothetical protein
MDEIKLCIDCKFYLEESNIEEEPDEVYSDFCSHIKNKGKVRGLPKDSCEELRNKGCGSEANWFELKG